MNPTMQNIEPQVRDLLSQMTLAEKIGQMTQPEKNSIPVEDVTRYHIGSVLSGGGGNPKPNSPADWRAMTTAFQEAALETRLGIPILYGVDAVHGHSNVRGATIFPHNIGLGAARDPNLVRRIGRVTALEMLATGVHWNFAPAVSVPQDIRWGRTYEGYSQDPDLVGELGETYLRGLQNTDDGAGLDHPHTVLGSVKHFLGDGGTSWGSASRFPWHEEIWGEATRVTGIDQGLAEVDEDILRRIHLAPYERALRAGARNIMVSYNSWGGIKMHAHRYLLTDVLKEALGFSGFLVSDWKAIDQIDPGDYHACVSRSINAGLDMIMVPFDYKGFIHTLTRAVERGDVPLDRINDAVARILRVKLEMNLFKRPFGDESLLERVGSPEHRAVAREAVSRSLVLLKNDGNALPLLDSGECIFVAGEAADDIGLQCGGWTIEWMGACGPITPGTTLLEALRKGSTGDVVYDPSGLFSETGGTSEYGIVVIAEPPYAEGVGDRANLRIPVEEIELIRRVRARVRKLVVVQYSGRPLLIGEPLALADAWVAAWLPGTECDGIVEALTGRVPFAGKLSYDWPRDEAQVPLSALRAGNGPPLFAFGFGI